MQCAVLNKGRRLLLVQSVDMNSEIPKWMPPEPAVRFPNQSEKAPQNKTTEEEEAEEMERCKRPRTTLDSEGGVEEFLVLLERIEEAKKQLKRKRMDFRGSSTSAGGGINVVEEDQMLMALPFMQQAQGSSDAVDTIAYNTSSTSPWKFQWDDFNISKPLSAQTELTGAAATEKNKDEEGSIQIGNGILKTRSFLDGVTPAECLHDHVDNVNREEDVNAPVQLELQLFPI
jgi:hypothetical protein